MMNNIPSEEQRLAVGIGCGAIQVGDVVIIMSYALMDFEEAKTFTPKVVFPENNRVMA